MEHNCLYCEAPISGRSDKKYCDSYCKSAYHNQKTKNDLELFRTIDRQLKKNRRILRLFNKSGKATVRKELLVAEGFDPKYFTHYWKNQRGQVYLFCYEFGFLKLKENGRTKYLLVKHQDYMA